DERGQRLFFYATQYRPRRLHNYGNAGAGTGNTIAPWPGRSGFARPDCLARTPQELIWLSMPDLKTALTRKLSAVSFSPRNSIPPITNKIVFQPSDDRTLQPE